jgi:hypothetical protein
MVLAHFGDFFRDVRLARFPTAARDQDDSQTVAVLLRREHVQSQPHAFFLTIDDVLNGGIRDDQGFDPGMARPGKDQARDSDEREGYPPCVAAIHVCSFRVLRLPPWRRFGYVRKEILCRSHGNGDAGTIVALRVRPPAARLYLSHPLSPLG